MTNQVYHTIQIDGTPIGSGYPPYIIAEISGNHGGSFETAQALIRAAVHAGVSAVKLQTYTPDMMTIDHPTPPFLLEDGLWQGQTLYSLYEKAQTPLDWHEPLFRYARTLGVTLFSSPFGLDAITLLEKLGTPAYKVASFELTDIPLLRRIQDTGKPVIVSTGMATVGEIETALAVLDGSPVALLHCTSAYPAPVAEANLATLSHMHHLFHVPVGVSDHTLGLAVPIAACALGAHIIEKHVCLSSVPSVDSAFSITEHDLPIMVRLCQEAARAVGQVQYGTTFGDRGSRFYRRSIYVVSDIEAGAPLTSDNIRVIRPGFGLSPASWDLVIGCPVTQSLKRGQPLEWDHILASGQSSASE